MSDSYRTERVERTAALRDLPHEREGFRRHLPPHAYEAPPRPLHHSAADMASVLGLPADHVTPEILAALNPLLAELDRLHLIAEQAEHRQAALERQADRHSVLPCLNRRAFLRELDLFLTGPEPHGSLALLHLSGPERLAEIHGLAAAEAALRHALGVLLGGLRASDLAGLVGGSDFAILLAATDAPQARAKLAELAERILHPVFTWLGQSVSLGVTVGVHQLSPNEAGEAALDAADRDRRGMLRD